MNCRDVREVADSFLCDELLTETNHEILRHLDTCPSCRTEIDGRRKLRGALSAAFDQAPDLKPSAGFSDRLRGQLREAAANQTRPRILSTRWLALVAGLVLAAGLGVSVLLTRSFSTADALARDAIGDHRNCALQFRLVRRPIPLEEAAQRFDSAYRVLLTAPPDDISTPSGPVQVLERHSCVYGARRFGHIVMRYHGRVVSLLMTANDETASPDAAGASPHVIGDPTNGMSVVSVAGSRHAILLVSDLESSELAQLSRDVSVPLAQRLEASLIPADQTMLAALFGAHVRQQSPGPRFSAVER